MKFHPTPLSGAYLIEPERRGDDRGFFARLYCEREFSDAGLVSHFVQANNALSEKRGTLRGLHYQLGAAAEVKLVRCIRGALWDVVVDLRPASPTFGKWFGLHLSGENNRMIWIPEGMAHGFSVVSEVAHVLYKSTGFYAPEYERTIVWSDPELAIDWKLQHAPIISAKDAKGVAWRDAETFE